MSYPIDSRDRRVVRSAARFAHEANPCVEVPVGGEFHEQAPVVRIIGIGLEEARAQAERSDGSAPVLT